ncbi:MAG TPA: WD40 repeat domain-containing protein [Planctomycetaceae bacterium]|nr:WD40 repeat domain-containing protein [Planctomycetaceae bacterium]
MSGSPSSSRSVWRGLVPLLLSGLSIVAAGAILAVLAAGVSPLLLDSGLSESAATVGVEALGAAVRKIQIAPDGRHVHVLRHPTEWQLVDASTGRVRQQQSLAPEFLCAVHPIQSSQNTFVYLDHHRCGLLHSATDRLSPNLAAPLGHCNRIAACQASAHVALFSGRLLKLWSTLDGSILAELEIDAGISCVEWSPDGRSMVVLTRSGQLQRRDGTTLELLQSQQSCLSGGGQVVWSSSGMHVAAYNQSGSAATWNLVTDSVAAHRTGVYSLQTMELTRDGDYLIVPDAYRDVWMIPTTGDDRQRRYLGTAAGDVSALCLVDEGQSLLVGTLKGHLESWSLQTGLANWTAQEVGLPDSSPPNKYEPIRRFAHRGDSCASTRS